MTNMFLRNTNLFGWIIFSYFVDFFLEANNKDRFMTASQKEKTEWTTKCFKFPFYLNSTFLGTIIDENNLDKIMLLLVSSALEQEFLNKNYLLEEQRICEELWQENRYLVVINQLQYSKLLSVLCISETETTLHKQLVETKEEKVIFLSKVVFLSKNEQTVFEEINYLFEKFAKM